MYICSCAVISEKFTVNNLPIALVSATVFNTVMYSFIVRGRPFILSTKNGSIIIITGTNRENIGENKL